MITKIVGTSFYVPEQTVTNNDLTKIMETNDEWIRNRTGIGMRRIATNEDTPYMMAEASVNVSENAGVRPGEIDPILLATPSPDYYFSNGAYEVQDKIGAIDAVCFDISAAYTGSVYALNIVYAFISSGIYKVALVINAVTLSKLIDWMDRGACMLLGDGADIVVVKADEAGTLGIDTHSDGTKGGVLTCGSRTSGNFLLGKKPELGYMIMNGQEVFKFVVEKALQCITEMLEDTGVKAENIRYLVIHQADYRIIESVAERLKVNVDRFPVNMEHYDNTSGALVPILLDELNRKGTLSADDKVVLSGFGAGLTWGAVLLRW